LLIYIDTAHEICYTNYKQKFKLRKREHMKYIYLFLTRTGTKVADIIGAITGDRFAHASIALDRRLEQLYSFARRGIYNPLRSGFEKENIHRGVFAIFGDCYCNLFRIPVTDSTYNLIRSTLEEMHRDKFSYRYNFIGLFSCAFGVPTNLRRRYTCSQFVSWILEMSGAAKLPKNMGLMKPDDLASLPSAELIYEGRIGDADRESTDTSLSVPIFPPRIGYLGRKA